MWGWVTISDENHNEVKKNSSDQTINIVRLIRSFWAVLKYDIDKHYIICYI
jgi:hypothetical protein